MKNHQRTHKKQMHGRKAAVGMAAVLCVTQLLSATTITALADGTGGVPLKDKYVGFEGVPVEWKYGATSDDAYSAYYERNQGKFYTGDAVDIPLNSFQNESGKASTVDWEGRKAVLFDSKSEYISFTVNIPESGLYQIEMDYYLTEGNSDAGKRSLSIDGVNPFTESNDLAFERYFMDESEPVINSLGDETRPSQIPIPGWRTTKLHDTSGLYAQPFCYYLEKGQHTFQIVYMKMDMYVGGIRLVAPTQVRSYAEVSAEYSSKGYKTYTGDKVRIQAELTAIEKSDPTLRRENDGDPLVEPASDVTRKLNIMGGYRWRTGNQSITWEFEVPEDGLYKIAMYTKQNWNDGLPSYRQIAIDGEVPFSELLEYKFEHDTGWNLITLSDENDTPYQFYLTAGTHYLTMTVKMGPLAEILTSIQEDITIISDMLLDINLIAGNDPDPNYDYEFFRKIPDLQSNMEYIVQSMSDKYDVIKGLAHKTPSMANNFLTIKAQVQDMLDDPFSIARRVGDLETSQTNLSQWYLALQSLPLAIDSFDFGSPEETWKNERSNFFQKLAATARQFISSFSKDYDNVGSILTEDVQVDTTITVWIARGTEWAEVIKEMADEDFTPNTGIAIKVNVLPSSQLNAGNVNALMLSITSGKAPDVALGVDITSPVEFAIRDQVYDLSAMEGFDEVRSRFVDATLTPYEYQGGVYALPETMNFNVMYYRKDLLNEYGIDLPNTRQDLYNYVMPALYQNGFQYYFGRDFTQFLFENGGSFYTEDGLKSALDTPEAYLAFKEYTEMFTNYGVPETANFYQYFRSGIMPLGVGDFNMYMQLSVAAPEIAGKWGIAPLAGVMKEDGTIDRTAGAITDKGDIIMKQSKYPEESWEFLKWWSSTETQTKFAKEVEALMGAEARWNTANKEAFLSLSWNDEDIEVLKTQWEWARETPTVLGGYFTSRHLTNAWTTVVISGGDVREALEQAVKDINRELRTKQEEYGVISND